MGLRPGDCTNQFSSTPFAKSHKGSQGQDLASKSGFKDKVAESLQSACKRIKASNTRAPNNLDVTVYTETVLYTAEMFAGKLAVYLVPLVHSIVYLQRPGSWMIFRSTRYRHRAATTSPIVRTSDSRRCQCYTHYNDSVLPIGPQHGSLH